MARLARSASARASLSSRSVLIRSVTSRIAAAISNCFALANRAQADLDGEFGSICAQREQLEPDAHGTYVPALGIPASVADVPVAKALGQQHLDLAAHDPLGCIAEQRLDLVVRKQHRARGIDDDHRIGCGVERAADEICRQHEATRYEALAEGG